MTASPPLLCSSSSAFPPTQEQKPPASSLTAHMGRQVSVHKAQDSESQVSRAKEASSSSAGMADHRLILTSVCSKPFTPADTTPVEKGVFSSFSSACSSFSSLSSSVAARDASETVLGLEEIATQYDKRPATVTQLSASFLPPLFKSVSQKLELRVPVLGPPATGAVPKTASATSPASVTQESSESGVCGSPICSPRNALVPAVGDSCHLSTRVVRHPDVSHRSVGARATYAPGAKETQGAKAYRFAQESLTADSGPPGVSNVFGFEWGTAFDKTVLSGRDLHNTAMIYSKSQPALTQLLRENASPREKQILAGYSNSSNGSVPCALAEIPAEVRKSGLFQTFPVKLKKSTQFLKRSNTGGEDLSVSPPPSISCGVFPNDPSSRGLSSGATGVCGKASQSLLMEKESDDFAQAASCNATARFCCHGPRPRAKTDAPGTSAGLTLPLSPRFKLCDSSRESQCLPQCVSPLEGYCGTGSLFTGRTEQSFVIPGQQIDGSGTNAATAAQFKASLRSHTRTWNPLAFLQSSNGAGGSEEYSTTSVSGPGPMSSRSLGSSLRKLSTLQSPVSGTVYEHTTSSSVFGRHDPQERLADFLVVHSQKLAVAAGAADAETAFSLAAAPFIERGRSATADPTTELNRPHSHYFSAGGFSLSPARPRHASGFEIGSATFAFPDTYYTPVFLSPHSTLSSQEEDSFSPSQFGCARKEPDRGPPCGDGAATAPASTMVVNNPSLTLANFVSSMNAEIQRSHPTHSTTSMLEARRSETNKAGLPANAVDIWDAFGQEAARSPARDTMRLDCYPPLTRQFCSSRGSKATEKPGVHLGASYPFFSSAGNLSPTLFDEPDGPFIKELSSQSVAAAGGGFPPASGFSAVGGTAGFPGDYNEEASWASRMRQQSGVAAPVMLQITGKRKQGNTSNVPRVDASSSPSRVIMPVHQTISDENAKAEADHSPYYACWSQHQVPSWASTAVATPTGPRVASLTPANAFDSAGHRSQCVQPPPHEKYKPVVTENNFFLQPGPRGKTSSPPPQRATAPYAEARQRWPRLLNPGVPTPSPTKNNAQDNWKSSSCQQPGVFHTSKAISSLLQGKGYTTRTERTAPLYDSSCSSFQPWMSSDHKTGSAKGTEHSCPTSSKFSVLLMSATPPATVASSPHQQYRMELGSQVQRLSDEHSEGKLKNFQEPSPPSSRPALPTPLSDTRSDTSTAQYLGHTENAPAQTFQHTHNLSCYDISSPLENKAVPKAFNQAEWQTFVPSSGPTTDTHWDVLCSMDELPTGQLSSPSVRSQKGLAVTVNDERDKDASRETCALLHGVSRSNSLHRPSADIEYKVGNGAPSPCDTSPVPSHSATHRPEESVTGWDGNSAGAPPEPSTSCYDNPCRQHLPTVPSAPRNCCGIQNLASFHTSPQSPLQCSSPQQNTTVSPNAWPKFVGPEAPLAARPACEEILTGFAATGAVHQAPGRGARTGTDFSGAPAGFRRGERSSYARCGMGCLDSSESCFQEHTTRAMAIHQLTGCCGVVAGVVSPNPYGTGNSDASVADRDRHTPALSEPLRNVSTLHGRPSYYLPPPPQHQPSPLSSHGCTLPNGSGLSCAVLGSSGEEEREGPSTTVDGRLRSSSSTFNVVLGGAGAASAQQQKVYSDDRDRMVYVSWIPKKARAYNTLDKRRMELSLKRKLREDLGLVGLTKVLLFPPKGVHCKLIFDCRGSATSFMACYGGDNRSVETERWKTDLCRIYHIDMHDKFNNTIVKIEWSQK